MDKRFTSNKNVRIPISLSRVLICFGPCAVKIDPYRFILNKSTGKTGKEILKLLLKRGYLVDLLVFRDIVLEPSLIRRLKKIKKYFYFEDFKHYLKSLLAKRKYDIIIFLSALPDFKPQRAFEGKMDSRRGYLLKLVPTEKVIMDLRSLQPQSKIIGFKLAHKHLLIKANKLLNKAKLNYVVANSLRPKYKAMIVGKDFISKVARTRKEIARLLVGLL